MVRKDQTIRRMFSIALLAVALTPFAHASDGAHDGTIATAAPLELPHTIDLLFGEGAHKRERKAVNLDSQDFPALTGLSPVIWPRNDDVRARLVTPELRRTPLFGWLAANLYRSKADNGWCLEVDPGQGEYVVFYRFHPRK